MVIVYKTIHVYHARSGKYNTENHDASGINTECQWITCDENEYVYINGDTKQCSACPPGLIMLLEIH